MLEVLGAEAVCKFMHAQLGREFRNYLIYQYTKQEKAMNAIAAADENWAIGYHNALLISIPEDMRFFREKTSGKVVVMGRKTLESFPGGKPLKNRVNIVFTSNPDYSREDITVIHSTEELADILKDYNSSDVFVIGGGSIYSMLLPMCDTAYITRIEKAFKADTWFPDLDRHNDWELTDKSETFEYEGIRYSFATYRRRSFPGDAC